eukprot:gene12870-14195_t
MKNIQGSDSLYIELVSFATMNIQPDKETPRHCQIYRFSIRLPSSMGRMKSSNEQDLRIGPRRKKIREEKSEEGEWRRGGEQRERREEQRESGEERRGEGGERRGRREERRG